MTRGMAYSQDLGFGREVCTMGGLRGDTAWTEESARSAISAETSRKKRKSLSKGDIIELPMIKSSSGQKQQNTGTPKSLLGGDMG